jgi:heme/copper-type cytochrome/quinol oxidase subunit 2
MVGVGILVLLLAVTGPQLIPLYAQQLPGYEGAAGLIIVFLFVILGIFGLLSYMLFRFSVLTRRGIETQDQPTFNRGLKGLKVYFLIFGTLAILSLLATIYTTINTF